MRIFPHNDVDRLNSHLLWAEEKIDSNKGRIIIVTESIFSMDGDQCPLSEIVALEK